MNKLLKKIFFGIPTLVLFGLFLFLSESFINNWDFLFSLNFDYLERLLTLILLLNLSGLFLGISIVLAGDLKIILPLGILLGLLAFLIYPPQIAVIMFIGILIAVMLGFLMIFRKLKNYINFEPATIAMAGIKIFTLLVIITFSFVFYLVSNNRIMTQGFELPDSIIETVLKSMPMLNQLPEAPKGNLSISSSQLDQLKKNPEILKQYGISPEVLKFYEDSLKTTQRSGEKISNSLDTNSLIKSSIKAQVNQIIKPYLSFIPLLLGIIFFITLSSISSLMSMFLPIFIFIIFYILEKSGFINFTKEMREIRKINL